ncbi:MAG TPA: hypothetical protein VFM55_15155 [Micromonosporaceae bacterium]|nr:hypothetical protein [Micromonosporaceae bacterium]
MGAVWPACHGLVLVVGVAGLVRVWASDRGFWNDELYVAVNVRDLSPHKLLTGPLRYSQVAPPGWLYGEKVMYQLFGGDEQVLRLPQLAAAVAVLVLTAVLAYRASGHSAALAATALLATSPLLYIYAGELKQYPVEAAAALAIVLMVDVLSGKGDRGRHRTPGARRLAVAGRALAFATVTTAAVSVSYSAVLVLAGAVGGLLLVFALGRRWRAMALTAAAAAPAALLGAEQVRRRMSQPFLRNQEAFFTTGLPPEGAGPAELLRWLPDMWRGFVASPLHWAYPWLVLGLALAGVVALVWQGRRLWAAVLVGVFGAAVGAAALGGLPVQDRVALYLVAPVAVAVAAALSAAVRALVQAVRGARRAVAVVLAVGLLVAAPGMVLAARPAAAAAVAEVRNPHYRDVGRDVMREVAGQVRPGDAVLVYGFSQPLASWYGTRYRLPVAGLATMGRTGACRPATVDAALAGVSRVWYVRGAKWSGHPDDYHARVVAELARRGRIMDARVFGPGPVLGHRPGWALVDLAQGPDPHPPAPAPAPDYACLTVQPQWL